MMNEVFDQTGTDIARHSGLTVETIRTYARAGLLEFRTLHNGVRLFQKSAAARAKKLCAQNIKRRGQGLRRLVGNITV